MGSPSSRKTKGSDDRPEASDDGYITIYEDWDEIDGVVWYKWRLPGDTAWHMKRTPHKQKPVIRFKQITPIEYDEFYAVDFGFSDKPTGEHQTPEGES